MWYAKPSGGYTMKSTEGTANILMMTDYFRTKGYTDEAIAGLIGNAYAESSLNPWRWQSDYIHLNGGYGLFQYTPASGYIDGCTHLQGYSPNMSVTEQTTGATPQDGLAQCICFAENTLSKWVSSCWRTYWSTTQYADLYAYRQTVLNTWGNGTRIYHDDYPAINDVYAATFVILACFEGALHGLDYFESVRVPYAEQAYEIIHGHPVQKFPVWLLLKWREKNMKGRW